ncbi:MAG: DUF951 domain-containing protein [Lachnospiraceae bacterium]|nr:DUF951 domain-containing protein [Lachnospiraceae bacterium]MDY5742333.1 DUF951 domain-containing protein [Lachnospiraceae bacterium]
MESIGLVPGAVIRMKKVHPCGSSTWMVLKIGADVKLKCEGCGHIIMLSRQKLHKSIREVENYLP